MKIPRRIIIDLNTPTEIAINKAIQIVEGMGADERLTDALTKLCEAKDLVSNYVDEQLEGLEKEN